MNEMPPTFHDFLSWKYHHHSAKGRMNCLLRSSGKITKEWMGDFAFSVSSGRAWKWSSEVFIQELKVSCPNLPNFWYGSVEIKRKKIFSIFSVAYIQKKINGLSPHVASIKTGEGFIRAYSDLGTPKAIYKIKLSSIKRLSPKVRTELVGFGNSDIQVLSFHATQEQKMMLVREIEEFLRHERKQERM